MGLEATIARLAERHETLLDLIVHLEKDDGRVGLGEGQARVRGGALGRNGGLEVGLGEDLLRQIFDLLGDGWVLVVVDGYGAGEGRLGLEFIGHLEVLQFGALSGQRGGDVLGALVILV